MIEKKWLNSSLKLNCDKEKFIFPTKKDEEKFICLCRSEYEFAEKIVEEAFSKLPPKQLHIGEHIVGLNTRIKDVASLLIHEAG